MGIWLNSPGQSGFIGRSYATGLVRSFGAAQNFRHGMVLSRQLLSSLPFRGWTSTEQSYFQEFMATKGRGLVSLTRGSGISMGFLTPGCPGMVESIVSELAQNPQSTARLDSMKYNKEILLLPPNSRIEKGHHIVLLQNGKFSGLKIEKEPETWAPNAYVALAEAFEALHNDLPAIVTVERALLAINEESDAERLTVEHAPRTAQIYAYHALLCFKYCLGMNDGEVRRTFIEVADQSAGCALTFNPKCHETLLLHQEIKKMQNRELADGY